jgi:hypothetical protein
MPGYREPTGENQTGTAPGGSAAHLTIGSRHKHAREGLVSANTLEAMVLPSATRRGVALHAGGNVAVVPPGIGMKGKKSFPLLQIQDFLPSGDHTGWKVAVIWCQRVWLAPSLSSDTRRLCPPGGSEQNFFAVGRPLGSVVGEIRSHGLPKSREQAQDGE